MDRALQTKVARRITLLFVACAVIPLAGLAGITSWQTVANLETQEVSRLRHDAKTAAMDALGQLRLLENGMRLLGSALVSSGPRATRVPAQVMTLFDTPPQALATCVDGRNPTQVIGRVLMPALTGEQASHFRSKGVLLLTPDEPDSGRPQSLLLISVPGIDEPCTLAASFDAGTLFRLDDEELLPPNTAACVGEGERFLACSPGAPIDVARRSMRARGEAPILDDLGVAYLAQTWELPIQNLYGGEAWNVTMMRARRVVRKPLGSYIRTFWLIAALSALGMSWVSLGQVRRQLRPLTELTSATRRLASRDFGRPVALHSGDEFEELGDAFNRLAQELKRQFAELEAFNFGTLAALARTIDAKSPWTAGHSERVTQLAVRIGMEMDLPAEEISDLQRGGLVHDIGKLATPPGILDKAGSLTPAETEIMRLHPKQGVHILEPIPAFERLLPIVGQHHERWDGSGYPDGLSGDRIARTARVLAVADVFDALRSDRPYRPGVPLADVVGIIRAGSARDFDPDVVDAFLRLADRGELESRAQPATEPRSA